MIETRLHIEIMYMLMCAHVSFSSLTLGKIIVGFTGYFTIRVLRIETS